MSTTTSSRPDADRLTALEGFRLLTAHEAVLKGALESDVEFTLIAGPGRDVFRPLLNLGRDEALASLLRQHHLRILAAPHAVRAITLAAGSARSGRSALALVPNPQLDATMDALRAAAGAELPPGAALCVLLEDDPSACAATGPRDAARRLDIACLEPTDLDDLRAAIEQAAHLSRAGGRLVAIVVHHGLLRAGDTIAVHPNRELEDVDAMIHRRRSLARRGRRIEAGGVLRTARRLELNRRRSMPNPGEREPVGFVVVGPAASAMNHLCHVLRLTGRVPILELRLLHPLDDVAVHRLLARCEQVVVLEPRPGLVESEVLASAERLRHDGQRPATIWGRRLPADAEGREMEMGPDDAVHPSRLARRVAHLLHAVRPAVGVVKQLVPDPPRTDLPLPARGSAVGATAARDEVLRRLRRLDEWLADEAPLEERGIPATQVALDGVLEDAAASRVVVAEVWEAARFQEQGISALRQAARDERPWIFVVCDFDAQDTQDLERLARGVVPEERADRVRIEMANLADLGGFRDLLREASLLDRLTVVVLRDGPPPRFDVEALEHDLTEVDRLGFEPRQRLVSAADAACAFRRPSDAADRRRGPRRDAEALLARGFSVEEVPRRAQGPLRIGVRPMFVRVEVIRTRPPAQAWRRAQSGGRPLPLPTPLHGNAPQWRVHLAGYRGRAGGPATLALAEAGRAMGYAVRWMHEATPLGPGRRAWSQVLYTRPRDGETPLSLSIATPFGEADLLVGLDPAETLRAAVTDPALRVAHRQRTFAVVNSGGFADDTTAILTRTQVAALGSNLAPVSREGELVVEDIAAACRAWFRTDRVTDIALLGIAFQRGWVPLSLAAMEAGLKRVEAGGFARAVDAFQFGRRLAQDQKLLSRPRADSRREAEHVIRRTARLLGRGRFRGRGQAERFARLMRRSLAAMPGLSETTPGRQARADFILATWRCHLWSGVDYAESYCDAIVGLYRADRGDHGRALTRCAILPLAEAMLIREPLYVLAVAAGPEQRRRTRYQLDVKLARGDRIERRFLTRFELVTGQRRYRLDVRTADGFTRVVAALRHVLPQSWRGSRRHRDLRRYVGDLVSQAAFAAGSDYDHWHVTLAELHELAVSDRLRGMTVKEVRETLEAKQKAMVNVEPADTRGTVEQSSAVETAPHHGQAGA